MARFSSFPTLFDDMRSITIADLKKMGFIEHCGFYSNSITWSRNGEKTAEIHLSSTYQNGIYLLKFNYRWNDEPRSYTVQTEKVKSNLGTGMVWYFVCPKTLKRCRKLHLHCGYFFHRTAFTDCLYETQTYSKMNRAQFKLFDLYFPSDDVFQQYYKKHRKKKYAGKPTKQELRLESIIRGSEQIPYSEKEKIFLL